MSYKNALLIIGVTFSLVACQVEIPGKIVLTGPNSFSGGGTAADGGSNNSSGGGNQLPPVSSPVPSPIPTPVPSPTPPAGANGPAVVTFMIAQGTGDGAWNTAQNPLVAKVGDTIRIVNMDNSGTRGKQLHTDGAPCAHANAVIPVGGSYDCVASKAFATNAANPDTYNHRVGSNAGFFIRITQ